MIDAPLALAFSAGLVAAVNPCGFAMLPAYLSYFLGTEGAGAADARAGVGRALAVSLAVTAGFMAVFGLVGLAISALSVQVYEYLPWVTAVIGVGLVVLGVAMLFGYQPVINLPHLERRGRDRSLLSMGVFGVSYAVASLSCTLPVFISLVGFELDDVLNGTVLFLVYGLGMGLVLTGLTLAIALARHSLERWLRTASRHVGRVSGALLVVAGGYVAYYGWYELAVTSGDLDAGGPAERVNALQADVQAWINDVGTERIGLVLGGIALLALAYALWRSPAARADRGSDGSEPPPGAPTPQRDEQPEQADVAG